MLVPEGSEVGKAVSVGDGGSVGSKGGAIGSDGRVAGWDDGSVGSNGGVGSDGGTELVPKVKLFLAQMAGGAVGSDGGTVGSYGTHSPCSWVQCPLTSDNELLLGAQQPRCRQATSSS